MDIIEHDAVEAGSRIEVRQPGVVVTIERRELVDEVQVCPDNAHLLSLSMTRRPQDVAMCYRGRAFVTDFLEIGPVTLLPAGMQAFARGRPSWTRLLLCSFDSAAYEAILGPLSGLDKGAVGACADLQQASIRDLLQKIGRELLSPGFASDLMIASLTGQVAVEIARRVLPARSEPAPHAAAAGKLTPGNLHRVEDYVADMLREGPTLEGAAKLCGMAPGRFDKAFVRSIGSGFAHYVSAARLAVARELLADTNLPLKEIGFRVGFRHASSFTAAFRRAMGITPLAYRLQSQG